MSLSRRNFIKRGILSAIAALFGHPLFSSFVNAKPRTVLKNKPEPSEWSEDKITIAWIGHSTVLINFYGKWILTDPVLCERIGLYFFGGSIGPTRLTPPALSIDNMPKPDLILLSHAHLDHMDYPTLKAFAQKYPNQIDIITSYLTKDVIIDLPWKSTKELDWNEEFIIHGIKFKALEVKHFGWRFPWEKDRSRGYMKDGRSYNAYLLERKGKKILFGGDTAFTDKLNLLTEENVEIAIMPIGAYNPWRRAHCNPEEALEMAARIKAKHFIPIHCKTFRQGVEPFDEPTKWMMESAPKYSLNIGINDIGQTFSVT